MIRAITWARNNTYRLHEIHAEDTRIVGTFECDSADGEVVKAEARKKFGIVGDIEIR